MGIQLVACPDLPDKESHIQLGLDCVMTLRNIDDVIVGTLAHHVTNIGLSPALGAVVPNLLTAMTVA